eukprot:scaffold121366_cov33-Phaeocystis_antarctica.AAC.1
MGVGLRPGVVHLGGRRVAARVLQEAAWMHRAAAWIGRMACGGLQRNVHDKYALLLAHRPLMYMGAVSLVHES